LSKNEPSVLTKLLMARESTVEFNNVQSAHSRCYIISTIKRQ